MSFLGDLFSIPGDIIKGVTGGLTGNQQGAGPQMYVPTGLGGADTQFQDWMRQIGSNLSGMQQFGNFWPGAALQDMLNLDPNMLSRAGIQAGNLYQGLIPQAQNVSNSLSGMGDALWQAGADPRGDLYRRTAQQVQDQSRAATSARGIGMSGEAAGIENQNMRNFNMDWQSQQLARMLQAGGAAGNLYQGALGANALTPGYAMQSGAVPWGAISTAAGYPLQAMSQYLPIIAAMNQQYGAGMDKLIPYMNYGAGATNSAFGQQQAGLGNTVGALGDLFRSGLPGQAWNWLSGLGGAGAALSDIGMGGTAAATAGLPAELADLAMILGA